MTGLRSRPSAFLWLLLVSAMACLNSRTAPAAVPVTGYIVINPIDVCSSAGPSGPTGCAPFNDQTQSPNPSQATSTTPIGFVDNSTNINLTRAIWLQAGIDVTFFPVAEFDNTNYQNIGDVNGTTQLYSCLFQNLSANGQLSPPNGTKCPTLPALKDPNCSTRHCTVPLASAKSNAINMFFVNSVSGSSGALYGLGWLNGNGVAISGKGTDNVFSFSSLVSSRFDTLAHELGHNLALDHCTYGAGDLGNTLSSACVNTSPALPCSGIVGTTLSTPGGCNLMDSGTTRNVAATSGCTAALTANSDLPTGGQLYNLDTGLYLATQACAAAPSFPISDYLIPSSFDNASTGFTSQQSRAKLSGFINPTANVNATAGAGSAAAALAVTTNSSSKTGITFTIPNQGGGRETACQSANPPCTEYVNNIVFAFANGITPAGTNALQSFSGPAVIQAFNLNGNNGENPNCEKFAGLAGPSVHCYEVVYQPGAFVPGTKSILVLNLTQSGGSVTDPQALQGSQFTPLLETDQLKTDQSLGTPIALFATTSTFASVNVNNVNVVQAGTYSPDPATASVLFGDPSTFAGTPNSLTGTQSPCAPQLIKKVYGCPPLLGGDPHGSD